MLVVMMQTSWDRDIMMEIVTLRAVGQLFGSLGSSGPSQHNYVFVISVRT